MSKVKILLVICILLFSLILRAHNYTYYPQRGATSDEYTYSFLGVSLLTKHIPISWSSFPEYKNRYDLTIAHLYFPIAYPYFDHPPLNGLLTGAFALAFGQNTFEKITLDVIRILPMILSSISSLLLFLIAYRLYGYRPALWALLIYTTTTIFVMNMRVVVAENLLTLLFLLGIYLLIIWKNTLTVKKIIILGILSGLAFLAKILGVALFFSFLYLFLNQKIKPSRLYIFIGVFLIFVGILLGYAAYYDWNLFWAIQGEQSHRTIGPETLLLLFASPTIVNKVVNDGWYFFGFFAMFYSFLDYQKNKYIVVPAFIYFMLLLISLTNQGHSGWYMIPLFPFMAIATSVFIHHAIEKMSFSYLFFILFIGMYHIEQLYEAPFGLTPLVFRILVSLLFFPLLYFHLQGNSKKFSFVAQVLFYIFILGNSFLTYNYVHPS